MITLGWGIWIGLSIIVFTAGWAVGHTMGRKRVLDMMAERDYFKKMIPDRAKEIDDEYGDAI